MIVCDINRKLSGFLVAILGSSDVSGSIDLLPRLP